MVIRDVMMSEPPNPIKLSRNTLLLFAGFGAVVTVFGFFHGSIGSTIIMSVSTLLLVIMARINKSIKTYQLVIAVTEIVIAGLLLIR